MTEPWAEQVADYLRRRGLPEARSGPRGELYGLGDLRAVALPLGVAETVAADAELQLVAHLLVKFHNLLTDSIAIVGIDLAGMGRGNDVADAVGDRQAAQSARVALNNH